MNAASSVLSARTDRQGSLTLTAALAPIVWGTTYLVTTQFLPPDRPMTASVLRAVPAGLLLLSLAPGVPPAGWRLKIYILATLNIGAFFPLLFLAAYRLPGGLAAVVGSLQPLVIAALSLLLGWGRAAPRQVLWSVVAAIGVTITTLTGTSRVDALGLAAASLGTVSMACGTLLTRRWGVPPGTHPLTSSAWQLLLGGATIAPLVPFVDHGAWHLNAASALGYAWLSVVGGAVAYSLWFRGARALPATNVALLAMLSPLTAAALGWIVLSQALSPFQCAGFAVALTGALAGQLKGQPVAGRRRGRGLEAIRS